MAPIALLSTALSLAAALGAWRVPLLAEALVARELTTMGLEGARFTLASVRWDRTTLTDVVLAPDLQAERVEIDYRDPFALGRGSIDAITISGARWTTSIAGVADSTPARLLAVRGEGRPPGLIRVVGASVVLPEATLVVDGDVVPATAGFAFIVRTDDGRASLDVSGDPRSMIWRLDGVVPPALAARIPEAPIDGELRASGHGTLGRTSRWVVAGEIALAAEHAHVAPVDAALDGVTLELQGEASIGDDLAFRLEGSSQIAIERASVAGARLGGARLAGVLRVDGDDAGLRASAIGPIEVRARTLAVGPSRADELVWQHSVLRASPRHDQPLFVADRDGARVALEFRGHSSASGMLRASSVGVTGALSIAVTDGGVRVFAPLHLTSADVSDRGAEVSLGDVRVDLPLAWDEDGRVSAIGGVHAGAFRWRELALGAVDGSLALSPAEVAIDWRGIATARAPFRLRASFARRTTIDVDVPVSEVGPADALHRALALTVGLDVRGRAGGELHVVPGSAGLGRALFMLDGASVDDVEGRGAAREVRGNIVLSSLEPVISERADRMVFSTLRLGRVLETRSGSARVRFEPSGMVEIDDAQASIAGGRLALAPFRFAPADPDLTLALTLTGVRMDRIAALLTNDGLAVSGVLDGHLGLRVHLGSTPSVLLGDGVLAARGPGRVRLTSLPSETASPDLERLANGAWMEQHVLAALADFEYSSLSFEIDHARGEPCLHATLSGHGVTTPQEVDLHVAVDDIQLLVDQSLRFSSAGDRAHT